MILFLMNENTPKHRHSFCGPPLIANQIARQSGEGTKQAEGGTLPRQGGTDIYTVMCRTGNYWEAVV